MEARVELCYQFPERFYPNVWKWLHDRWDLNSDDFGPKNFSEFEDYMISRTRNEEVWCVLSDGTPVGVIGYLQLSPIKGLFRGICFSPKVQGTPITRQAVSMLLEKKFSEGTKKIGGCYFQSNRRVARFLESLGAKIEGLLIADTEQRGRPINSVVFAFFA